MVNGIAIATRLIQFQKGYVQNNGVAYDETFAPVVPFDVVHFIVGRFTSGDQHVHHAKFSTGFLNRDIDGELYVWWDTKYFTLQKRLYSMNQSPHLRHEKLMNALKRFGFTQLESSECVFKLRGTRLK